MGVRKIVNIDEEKCTGCGECIIDCHEGALQIVNGKAKIINDVYCDGLGDCLKGCPVDAITIIEREAEEFDMEAVNVHLENRKKEKEPLIKRGCPSSVMSGCPSSKAKSVTSSNSSLTQWPVQLTLLNPAAPYFKEADLLISADCVPFAYKDFHSELLDGKKLGIGCPKLDNIQSYVEKIRDIINENSLKSLTVAKMEVPCCGALLRGVLNARSEANSDMEINVITVSTSGEIISREVV